MRLIEGIHFINDHPANIQLARAINEYEDYFDTHASAEEKLIQQTGIEQLTAIPIKSPSLIHDTRELNYRLNIWESYYKKSVLSSYPIFMQLSADFKCNISCIFCSLYKYRKKEGDFTLQDFKKISPILDFTYRAGLSGEGEPLFNPYFEDIWDYIVTKYPGININLCTNGILLNDHWIDKIIEYNNCAINISLNAGTRETYKKIMGADYFLKVKENIYNLRSAMNLIKPCNIQLSVSIVVINENLKEIPRFIDVAKELDTDIKFKQVYDENEKLYATDPEKRELVFKEAAKKLIEVQRKVISTPSNFFKYANNTEKLYLNEGLMLKKMKETASLPLIKNHNCNFCTAPWAEVIIVNEGWVAPCHYFPRPIGNLHEQTFEEIWNGKEYIKLRETVNTDNQLPECQNCILNRRAK